MIFGFKMESNTAGGKHNSSATTSLYNLDGKLEVIGGFLYTLGSKRSDAPRVNGRPETYYPIILRQGTIANGKTSWPRKSKTLARLCSPTNDSRILKS